MRQHTEAREAARLKALHDVLAIRPDQESAFQAFAARPTRPQNGGPGWRGPDDRRMAGGTAGAGPEPTTAPERIDAALRRFDERTSRMRDALQQRAATVKSFYAVLSPDQRRTLDALPQLTGHGGWGGRGDAGPRGPGGGMGQGRPGEGE
jgi:hypothetical protein